MHAYDERSGRRFARTRPGFNTTSTSVSIMPHHLFGSDKSPGFDTKTPANAFGCMPYRPAARWDGRVNVLIRLREQPDALA